MKIKSVRAHPITTKLDKVYWTSRGAWGTYNMVLVEVETDDGLIGYGQINKTPLKEIAEIVEGLEEVIRGMDALAHEAVWTKILNLTVPHLEPGIAETVRPRFDQNKRIQIMAALGGIDIALWDIKGKAFELPLWRLLGGERREVPAYASGGYYEEGYSPLAVIDEMGSYAAQGYRAVKMKCGGLDIAGDMARIKGVREAIGDADLMLDGNGAYSLKEAEIAIKSFEPYRIFWFEEPLHWYDFDAIAGAACYGHECAAGERRERASFLGGARPRRPGRHPLCPVRLHSRRRRHRGTTDRGLCLCAWASDRSSSRPAGAWPPRRRPPQWLLRRGLPASGARPGLAPAFQRTAGTRSRQADAHRQARPRHRD